MDTEMKEGRIQPYRPDLPYDQRSAAYDKYAGRLIRGWVFAKLDSHLNGVRGMAGYEDRPSVRCTQVIARVWDGKINGRSELLFRNSGPQNTEFACWMVDCAEMHKIIGKGWEHGYRVAYESRTILFGGSGHYDTLEEATAAFDSIIGHEPEQTTLF